MKRPYLRNLALRNFPSFTKIPNNTTIWVLQVKTEDSGATWPHFWQLTSAWFPVHENESHWRKFTYSWSLRVSTLKSHSLEVRRSSIFVIDQYYRHCSKNATKSRKVLFEVWTFCAVPWRYLWSNFFRTPRWAMPSQAKRRQCSRHKRIFVASSAMKSLVNCSYTGLGLGLRFRVRYTRNPVYPNTRLYKTYCELFLRGTEILGPVCARIPV